VSNLSPLHLFSRYYRIDVNIQVAFESNNHVSIIFTLIWNSRGWWYFFLLLVIRKNYLSFLLRCKRAINMTRLIKQRSSRAKRRGATRKWQTENCRGERIASHSSRPRKRSGGDIREREEAKGNRIVPRKEPFLGVSWRGEGGDGGGGVSFSLAGAALAREPTSRPWHPPSSFAVKVVTRLCV